MAAKTPELFDVTTDQSVLVKYERGKKRLQKKGLSAKDYEQAVRKLADRLKI